MIYSIDGGATWSTNNVFSGLSSNIYLISIAYADTLCEVSGTPINLSDPSAPIVNTVTPTNPSICGGTDGQITINSTPATGLIYSVDGGNTWNSDNTFTGLTAGFYAVQIAFSDTTSVSYTHLTLPTILLV